MGNASAFIHLGSTHAHGRRRFDSCNFHGKRSLANRRDALGGVLSKGAQTELCSFLFSGYPNYFPSRVSFSEERVQLQFSVASGRSLRNAECRGRGSRPRPFQSKLPKGLVCQAIGCTE